MQYWKPDEGVKLKSRKHRMYKTDFLPQKSKKIIVLPWWITGQIRMPQYSPTRILLKNQKDLWEVGRRGGCDTRIIAPQQKCSQ
jgi:hypothetical protein